MRTENKLPRLWNVKFMPRFAIREVEYAKGAKQ